MGANIPGISEGCKRLMDLLGFPEKHRTTMHEKVDHLNETMAGRLDHLEKLLSRRQIAE